MVLHDKFQFASGEEKCVAISRDTCHSNPSSPSLPRSRLSRGETSPTPCYQFMLIFNRWALTQGLEGPNLRSLAGPLTSLAVQLHFSKGVQMIDASESLLFYLFSFWKDVLEE